MDKERVRDKLIEWMKEAKEHLDDICCEGKSCEDCPWGKDSDCLLAAIADRLIDKSVTIFEEEIKSAAAICELHEMRERAEKMRLLYEGVESGEIFACRWIPVSEMPPEENMQVLVYGDGCYALSEIYTKDEDGTPCWSYTGIGCDPTHWAMPIIDKPNVEGWKTTYFGKFTANVKEKNDEKK